MRITIANDVHLAQVIVLAHLKAIYNARRYMEHAQHYHHCRREILAMTLFAIEQEFSERIFRTIFQIQTVAVMSLQVHFDGPGPIISVRDSPGNFMREALNPRIEP